ncbi:MAG: type II toxin-antitoxin system PemK/MazF family toxin [Lachnospiraceae bacterium]
MNDLNRAKLNNVVRGDMYYADLSPVIGSEQGGIRPVLVIQNDTGNRHSPTVIVAAITSKSTKAVLPTHVAIPSTPNGLKQDSTVLTEQIRTIDRRRLKEYIGRLEPQQMVEIDLAMLTSLGLPLSAMSRNQVVIHAGQSFV